MDTRLMELLVCPLCKGPLTRSADATELICNADRLAYPIRDGMAVMLEAQSRPVEPPAPPSPPVLPGPEAA